MIVTRCVQTANAPVRKPWYEFEMLLFVFLFFVFLQLQQHLDCQEAALEVCSVLFCLFLRHCVELHILSTMSFSKLRRHVFGGYVRRNDYYVLVSL